MRVRAVALMAIAVLLALSPQVGATADQEPQPYSPEWLAKYHTQYDNAITAQYEAQTGYGQPSSGAQASTGGVSSGSPLPGDVRMSNPGFAGGQNEFQIDINPLDHRFAIGASNDSRLSGTGYYRTSDGGATWFAADLPLGQSSCCDPGIAYADDNTAYFINLDTSPAVFHVMKTTNNGMTWTMATDVSPGDDRENIVVDNSATSPFHGRIYVTYTDFGISQDEIRLFYSTNGALSWTGPINVSHVGGTGAAYPQSSQPRVANDGTVYVGFQYYPDGTHDSAVNLIAKSTNGGQTFQAPKAINTGPNLQGGLDIPGDARGYFAINSSCSTFRHRSFPIIGVDPTNSQNVYALWAGGNLETPYSCGGLSGFHSDVLFSRSTDGGSTWSAPLKVNDDPSGKDQYYPWMDVAPNGIIYVGWHDRRNDPSNFRHAWYVDRSTNGGLSFGPDFRVADVLSQPDTFIGDYAGLAAENDKVLPMWWDSRDSSTGDPYTQALVPPPSKAGF